MQKAVPELSQKEEIEAICKRLRIEPEELADRAKINWETFRKIAGGHQKAGQRAMNDIRNVERMGQYFQDAQSRPPSIAGRPYAHIGMDNLMRSLSDVVASLKKATPHERKHILGSLRAFVDELEARELESVKPPPPPSSPLRSGAGELTQRIGDGLDRDKP